MQTVTTGLDWGVIVNISATILGIPFFGLVLPLFSLVTSLFSNASA